MNTAKVLHRVYRAMNARGYRHWVKANKHGGSDVDMGRAEGYSMAMKIVLKEGAKAGGDTEAWKREPIAAKGNR